MKRNLIIVGLFFASNSYVQAQETDLCPVDSPDAGPCNAPEFRTCPNLPNYRRFCDADGSILEDGVSFRTICAPCSSMDGLLLDGDYCGDCVRRETPSPTDSPTASPTSSPVTIIPATPAPVTDAPVVPETPAPVVPATASPVTSSPVTAPVTPDTASPVTASPVTSAPVIPETASPVTSAPVTPETASPVTSAPVTPETASPVTSAPVTASPITSAPVTDSPVTSAPIIPDTASPVTASPVTSAPVTPDTASPVTASPVTSAPVTASPVTSAPITASPVTSAPVTASPVTSAPVTASPVTAAPVTASPVTVTAEEEEEIYAEVGEKCEGFNEMTGESYPNCKPGLSCEDASEFSLLGSGKECVLVAAPVTPSPVSSAPVTIYAEVGEKCEGFNEMTGESYPNCKPGLSCEDASEFSLLGSGKECVLVVAPVTPSPVSSAPVTPSPVSPAPVAAEPEPVASGCPEVHPTGCAVCGPGKCVGNPDAVFEFPGQPAVVCGVLELTLSTENSGGLLPVGTCPIIPSLIGVPCECKEG